MSVQRIELTPVEILEDAVSRSDPALRAVWDLLEEVKDPEIPVLSLRDLGILRGVHHDAQGWRVVITPTYSGCPAMRVIEEEVRAAMQRAGYTPLRVETRLAPAWTTDWMSVEGRERLRAYGIAPPAPEDGGSDEHAPELTPPCPQCGSTHTRRISEFGSTACKALYQCQDCREPFDYFKRL
jgi:ring-1,2-phenylacetyl-CoA epoxidase subunit PaaD